MRSRTSSMSPSAAGSCAPATGSRNPKGRGDRTQHVVRALAQLRALADQIVGPLGARIERRARHGQHLASLFAGEARGDQRAGSHLGLDHDHRQGETRDQPVAAREVAGLGLGAGGLSETTQPFSTMAVERAVFGRIDVVDPAAEHRHRARRQRPVMRRRVDAPRHARDDELARGAQVLGESAGEALPGGRGDPRPDHGDGGPAQAAAMSPRAQISGGGGSSAASSGGNSGSHEAISRAPNAAPAASSRSASAWLGMETAEAPPPASGSSGRAGQHLLRGADTAQELLESDRPDALGPGEPQPGAPAAIRQRLGRHAACVFFAPISAPRP